MTDFTLPSGRVVPLNGEPRYGDILDADDAQMAAGRGVNAYWLTLMTRLASLSQDEVRALSPEDGNALFRAVKEFVDGPSTPAHVANG